ncbi:MAG TPA: M15 family metallopeptidase [Marmoricola sp.]|nr:M15 family metallopeptidase [Marmoricola sp.]
MSIRQPARATAVAVVALGIALIGFLGHPLWAASSPPSPPHPVTGARVAPLPKAPAPRHRDGATDGVVPDGVTVFDQRYPAVTKLDPALLSALRRAATDAGRDGVRFYVNSGWRSPAYQEHLLDEAVATYGSRERAAQWVATPTTSAHVSGDAVDLGQSDADSWLAHHGAAYGLCQIYRNEPWHYELRPAAAHDGCPAMYADPTHDPRMQP